MESAAARPLLPNDSLGKVPTSRYVVFFSIAIIGLIADLVTKQVLFAWLGLPQQDKYFWIVKDYVGFQTAVNRGALFGMGAGYWWLFSLLSVVAAVGIVVWLFYFRAAHDRLLNVALACVMAGIFGNLYDRLGLWDATGLAAEYEHGVRDWILFRYRQYTWPNFNIADCLLVCGAGMLMLHAWLGPRSAEELPTQQPIKKSQPS
ncbi:Lipoprotein signal peptidase [Anatilimnocola aggregata]|uniref:Lipoprotein signal peptidase n=2 Tax=Anatilimnocola aggregata TaxID=2528021 RepID=A0A517Y739_9BACT|nr:Lipoprotein signal peptidase [Anatilimnocola aggregata]